MFGGIFAAILLVVIIVLGVQRLITETTAPPYDTVDTINGIDEIQVMHSFSEGTHLYRGFIPAPTPCHSLLRNVTIMESFPEEIRIDFETRPGAELCAQVVSKLPFEATAEASAEASLTLSINGFSVRARVEEVQDPSIKDKIIDEEAVTEATSSTTEGVIESGEVTVE